MGLRRSSAERGDRELVEACLAGDERAWETLVRRYKGLVFSIPLRYHATPEDAEDILQAVFIELFNDLPRLRNRDNLGPWLSTVAKHQAWHFKRKRGRRGEHELEGVSEVALESVGLAPGVHAEIEREQRFRLALSRVPERCRKLVLMLFFEDPPRPYAEVAQELGLAEGSIGFIRGRCLKRVEKALQEVDGPADEP
jgi:RNA polymerase sigma factor (sigma-70 family)